MTDPAPPSAAATYSERLRVPIRWWVLGVLAVFVCFVTVSAALPSALFVAVTVAVAALVLALLIGLGRAALRVGPDALVAGRARLPMWAVGNITVLDGDGTRRQAGQDADPRAYLVLRSYVTGSVRIDVVDPADPTPYWLLSSRRPEQLATVLRAAATNR